MRHARDDLGQTIVIAGLLLTMILGIVGLGVDIGWFELNLVRIQRAADAGALAGVVYLPGNLPGAVNAALAEASKNGYVNGSGGVVVVAGPAPGNAVIMDVSIQAPVPTYFARLLGIWTIQGARRARAEFVLPVPMGSPEDYYGIARLCPNTGGCSDVLSASGSGTLASQGFWGSVLAKGADRQNGDAYSTYYNLAPALNTGFDANGYSYIVDFPAGTVGGSVWIFDPIFCAVGRSTSTGAWLGTGDYWYNGGGTPITTEFKLWDMNGTPYSTADDTLIASDAGLFANMNYVDKGPNFKGDQFYGGGGYNGSASSDCQASPYHNKWWRLAFGLGEGQYRLQVTTSSGTTGQNARNQFGIQVLSASGPGGRVYGQSRMAAYVNIYAMSAVFYLAQIDAVHAGKTLDIKLFDPGDIFNTTLRIKQPTSTGYVNATFNFTATGSSGGAPTSGGPVTSLQTSSGGIIYYNNQWVTITIPLAANYTAPTPPGETEPGWWKIEYTVGTSGTDVTTWEVSIRGNPVHLIVP